MFQLTVRLWTEKGMLYPTKFSVMYDVTSKTSSVRAFVKNDKYVSTDYMLITPFDAINGVIFEKDLIVVDSNYDIFRVVEFNMEEGVYQAINIKDDKDILKMTSAYGYETVGNIYEDKDLIKGTKYDIVETKETENAIIEAASKPDTEEVKKKDNEPIKAATKEENSDVKPAELNSKKEPLTENNNKQKQQNTNQVQNQTKKPEQENKPNPNAGNASKNGNNNQPKENNKQNGQDIKQNKPQNEQKHINTSNAEKASTNIKENKAVDSLKQEAIIKTDRQAEKKEEKEKNKQESTEKPEQKVDAKKETNTVPPYLKENLDGQMTFSEPDESDYINPPKPAEEKSALKNTSDKTAKAELHFISECTSKNGSYVFSVISRGMEETFLGEEENTDSKKLALQGLIDSLSSFEGSFNVVIYTDSQYVVYPFLKGWINKWKNSNWYKNDTDRIQNYELWAQLLELSNKVNAKWEFVPQPTEQMIKCKNILKTNAK